ncbi:MAG TPA: DUF5947 family protein [Verrucomicrobiae bacterium]|nr:DUF5947 family protein [Verrucomicrobiae bacterium]
MNSNSSAQQSMFAMLRKFAQPRGQAERCEFCSLELNSEHRHVLETATRKISCACDSCALRFDNVVGQWKLIPRDARRLPDFQMTDPQWESFSLPINLAFFFHSTPAKKIIALFPSPAGATESLVQLTTWETLVLENPVLSEIQSDIEALLVNRLNSSRDYFLAPIDVCFELVGIIRLHWRGLSGGEKVRTEIEKFFAKLNSAARVIRIAANEEVAHA